MPLTSTLEKTPPPLPGKTVDNTLPSPGGNLAVVPDSETSSGFSLSWDKGSDDQTSEAQLRYLVYISDQDNITGVQNAENNGTLLNPDEADQLDINTYIVTGQNPETQYWATVILKDQGGNKSAYGVVTATTTATGSGGLDSTEGDIAALEALYVSTNGGSWTGDSTGWASSGMSLSPAPAGVTVVSDRVTEIDLKNYNLTGSLPEELQNLKQCTSFDVRQGNFLTGDIPEGLWGMTALTHLYLEGRDDLEPNYTSGGYHPGKTTTSTNDFTGQLSSGIGNLTNLVEFWLERQGSMTGPIPSAIGNLTNLKFFSIFGKERDHVSGFNGEIPSEIGNCTSLVFLLIGRNAIGGTLPTELGSCTNLKTFWFGGSNISGNLPASFANLTQMKFFFHDRNGITGPLPSFVFDGSWPELNTFTHVFPEDENGQDVAGYDADLGTIDWSNTPNIQHIGLSRNALTGALNSTITQIDPEIFDVPGFPSLVTGNVASGTLPQTGYENWTNVRYWRLTGTNVGGAIPTGYGSIEELHFSDNNFSSFNSGGEFDLQGVNQLESVTVSLNRLTPKDIVPGIGVLPSYSYGNQKPFDSVEEVDLNSGGNYTIDKSHQDFTNNSYQWYKDGVAISGETSHTLQLTNVDSGDAGDYVLKINHPDVAQEYESEPITITVT